MLNQKYRPKKTKIFMLLGTGLLLVVALALSAYGVASVAAAATVEPPVGPGEAVAPLAQRGNQEAEVLNTSVELTETTADIQAADPEVAEDMRVLFEEMTLVQLLWEQYGYAKTACAGNGLNNIQPLAEGPMILIPNAGDLSVDGSNVSIKLSSKGEITFIPRVQGQRIRIPMDVGDKVAGEEVLSLTLDEARQLMAAGKLVWTAKNHGPFGNGHGLPGHIAQCDPLFDKEQFEEFEGIDKEVDES